ncbi:MAG: hypothetical protein PHV49_04575 [Alistipes sp.]|nr:hypothetical protein [Alistipes sp.]
MRYTGFSPLHLLIGVGLLLLGQCRPARLLQKQQVILQSDSSHTTQQNLHLENRWDQEDLRTWELLVARYTPDTLPNSDSTPTLPSTLRQVTYLRGTERIHSSQQQTQQQAQTQTDRQQSLRTSLTEHHESARPNHALRWIGIGMGLVVLLWLWCKFRKIG